MRVIFVTGIFLLSLFLALPRIIQIGNFSVSLPGIWWNWNGFALNRDLELKFGLDLAGGSSIVFEADMSKIPPADREQALEAARDTVERRVNLFGVSESVIRALRIGDAYRISVELPGVYDTSEAVALIGKTAQLEFWELQEESGDNDSTGSSQPTVFNPTNLTGSDLKRARVEFSRQTGEPIIALQFNKQGAEKFEKLTEKNIGKPLAIVLDGQIITSPIVQQKITGGNAVITGNFSLEQAKKLTVQLNSGALPVPLQIVEQRSIEPFLGQKAIKEGIVAGVVGITAVFLFMLLFYRYLGIFSVIGLVFYATLTIAVYKLLPVVLTLPGIAGLLLSLGMAVDTNILVFERIKEALNAGEYWSDAVSIGFEKAWSSIRDANIAAVFIVLVLFNPLNFEFLHTSGPVRGFALTLGIGILINLFVGVFVLKQIMERIRGGLWSG